MKTITSKTLEIKVDSLFAEEALMQAIESGISALSMIIESLDPMDFMSFIELNKAAHGREELIIILEQLQAQRYRKETGVKH